MGNVVWKAPGPKPTEGRWVRHNNYDRRNKCKWCDRIADFVFEGCCGAMIYSCWEHAKMRNYAGGVDYIDCQLDRTCRAKDCVGGGHKLCYPR
jgi:hypothetical protein